MATDARSRWLERALSILFAASGCAGLIYQSVWTAYLGNFLGHAAYAQSLVLAIFMGGMALGAWVVGRRAPRVVDPLRGYAWTEALIGVFGFAFHPLFVAVSLLGFEGLVPALSSPGAISTYKWAVAVLLVLPQSILLGMTFPLLATGCMRRVGGHDGRILAGLYFSNSVGAALGALLATFSLVPAIGLPGAMQVAGTLNLLVALGASGLTRVSMSASGAAPAGGPEAPPALPRLILVAAALTGATSFVYELGWVRMLNLALGSSVHSFELMLAAFIGGLAFGGLVIRARIDRLADALRTAGHVQVLMGVAALASLALYNGAFDWMQWLMRVLSREREAYLLFNLGSSAIALALMVPAAFFAGMTLPLFTLALLRQGHGERSVGAVYAANTLGAIAGVFLAMHALIPGLGLKLAMILAAAVDVGLGIVILRVRLEPAARIPFLAASAAGVGAVVLALAFVQFDPWRMSSGVFRNGNARLSANNRVVYQRDGKTASVAFVVSPDGVGSISTNGKVDAAIQLSETRPATGDEYTMALLALLPMSIHDAPRRVGIIGFGSGMTAHTLLGDPRVELLDNVEIEPAMVVGAHGFGDAVARAFDDPRSRVHFDDAKTFFASRPERYDVIVSEPSNPWVNGVAGLFSQEFYRFLPRHLNPDGLYVQWLQAYEIDMPLAASVVKALATAFARIEVYESNSSDLIIVCSPAPRPMRPGEAVFVMPALAAQLERLHLRSSADLRVRWLADERALLPLASLYPLPANSDYYPVLAYGAPVTRFLGANARALGDLARAPAAGLAGDAGAIWPRAVELNGAASETGVRMLAAEEVVAALADPAHATFQVAQPALRQAFDSLLATTARCTLDRDRAAIYAALAEVAQVVIPFAGPERQAAIWQGPTFRPCLRGDESFAALLDLYQALGMRDVAATRQLAARVLEGGVRSDDADFARFALLAGLAGAAADGDAAGFAALRGTYGATLRLAGNDRLQADYLQARVMARRAPPAGIPDGAGRSHE